MSVGGDGIEDVLVLLACGYAGSSALLAVSRREVTVVSLKTLVRAVVAGGWVGC